MNEAKKEKKGKRHEFEREIKLKGDKIANEKPCTLLRLRRAPLKG